MKKWMVLLCLRGVCAFSCVFRYIKFQIEFFLIYFFINFIILVNELSMVARKDYIHYFLKNLGFSKKLILLITNSSGLAILLIGSFIENNFRALSFPVFLILFLFYLFLRVYNNFDKKVRRY